MTPPLNRAVLPRTAALFASDIKLTPAEAAAAAVFPMNPPPPPIPIHFFPSLPRAAWPRLGNYLLVNLSDGVGLALNSLNPPLNRAVLP